MSMSKPKWGQARRGRIAQRVRHLRVLEDISASLKRMEEHLTQERTIPDEPDHVKQSASSIRDSDSDSGQGIVMSKEEEDAIRRKYYETHVRLP
jgi:hypothetical protein